MLIAVGLAFSLLYVLLQGRRQRPNVFQARRQRLRGRRLQPPEERDINPDFQFDPPEE